MQILVLTKPVPDPAAGAERLGPGPPAGPRRLAHRRQRQRRVRARGRAPARRGARRRGGRPDDGPGQRRPRRCARPSRWAPMRGILVTDEALAGADLPTTIRVLAAAVAAGALRPAARRPRHVRRGGRRRHRRRRRPPRPAAAVRRRRDRAGPGGRPRPRAPPLRQGLRPGRGADAGGHLVHPGARRAALPVAQGDHGRALARDRDPLARGPGRRPGAGRRCLGHHGPRRGPAAGARRRARDLGRRPPDTAREIADFLADRRII